MDPLALSSGLSVPLRFLLGVAGGVFATLGMDLAMARLPEGETPPSVASGVLTGRRTNSSPDRLATAVHYLAGGLTGPLFVWLLYAGEGLLGGPSLGVTLGATLALYVLMVGFFAVVVLPRATVSPGRVPTIRRDWALSAAAYLLVLVPVVAGGSALL